VTVRRRRPAKPRPMKIRRAFDITDDAAIALAEALGEARIGQSVEVHRTDCALVTDGPDCTCDPIVIRQGGAQA